jgi:hypothetical protein
MKPTKYQVKVDDDRQITYFMWNNKELIDSDYCIVLLLLHGMTENACIFDPFIPLLFDENTSNLVVIAIDRPGYGESSTILLPNNNQPYSYESFLVDIQKLLTHVQQQQQLSSNNNIKSLFVIGHSSGAPYAFALQSIATMVWLFAPDINYFDDDYKQYDPISPETFQDIVHHIKSGKISQLTPKEYGFISDTEYEPIEAYRNCLDRNKTETNGVEIDYGLERHHSWKWLSTTSQFELKCKQLYIFLGTADPFMPIDVFSKWWSTKIPQIKIIEMKDRGHFNCLFSPDVWKNDIRNKVQEFIM